MGIAPGPHAGDQGHESPDHFRMLGDHFFRGHPHTAGEVGPLPGGRQFAQIDQYLADATRLGHFGEGRRTDNSFHLPGGQGGQQVTGLFQVHQQDIRLAVRRIKRHLEPGFDQRAFQHDLGGTGRRMEADLDGLLAVLHPLQQAFPAGQGRILGHHQRHAFRLQRADDLHGRPLVDAGHDGRDGGDAHIQMLLGKKRGGLGTALGHDQIEDGNGLAALDELVAFAFHKRFQINAQISEGLTA